MLDTHPPCNAHLQSSKVAVHGFTANRNTGDVDFRVQRHHCRCTLQANDAPIAFRRVRDRAHLVLSCRTGGGITTKAALGELRAMERMRMYELTETENRCCAEVNKASL